MPFLRSETTLLPTRDEIPGSPPPRFLRHWPGRVESTSQAAASSLASGRPAIYGGCMGRGPVCTCATIHMACYSIPGPRVACEAWVALPTRHTLADGQAVREQPGRLPGAETAAASPSPLSLLVLNRVPCRCAARLDAAPRALPSASSIVGGGLAPIRHRRRHCRPCMVLL